MLDEFIETLNQIEAQAIDKWLVKHMEHYPGPHIEVPPFNPFTGKIGVCSCKERVQFKWEVDFPVYTLKVTVMTNGS